MVHYLKHPETGWYYRIGPREHFLLSRMDGRRSLEEIGAEYADEFHKRLGPESWQQLFGMLWQRQLLAGADDPEMLARLTRSAVEQAERTKRGLLLARFPLFDPDRLFTRVGPRLSRLFSPGFVIPALLAVVTLAGYVGANVTQFYEAAFSGGRGILVFTLPILWGIVFLHECAHGLTCWHFGGRVKEIGVIWRFPLLAPYCKVDDVVLLPRGQRLATAFAGVFVTMLALLPFAGIWAIAPEGHLLSRLAAVVLLFGTLSAAVNLVPFLRLDGYYMLSHALNLTDLRMETYRFYSQLVRRGPRAVAGYKVRDQIAYALYGFATVALVVGLVAPLAWLWYTTLADWLGPVWSVLILTTEALLLAWLFTYAVRRAQSRMRAASSTGDGLGEQT